MPTLSSPSNFAHCFPRTSPTSSLALLFLCLPLFLRLCFHAHAVAEVLSVTLTPATSLSSSRTLSRSSTGSSLAVFPYLHCVHDKTAKAEALQIGHQQRRRGCRKPSRRRGGETDEVLPLGRGAPLLRQSVWPPIRKPAIKSSGASRVCERAET